MSRQLKLIIADDEQLICSMLERIIDLDGLGLEHIGTAYDGESLLEMIRQGRPDIVVTDICMPKIDGLEIIRRVKEMELACHFVIISGYRHFEYAYNALKYNVEDYILKPIDVDEMNATLKKIAGAIREDDDSDRIARSNSALRRYFITKGLEELRGRESDLRQVNETYGTRFQAGMFQCFSVRIDYPYEQSLDDAESPLKKFSGKVIEQLSADCFDLLLDESFNSLCVLANYREQSDRTLRNRVTALFFQLQNLTELFRNMVVTMCISNATDKLGDAWEMIRQTRVTEWARMVKGTNRILFYSDIAAETQGEAHRARLESLRAELVKSFETINIELFQACMDSFFSLPTAVLCQSVSLDFIQEVHTLFFALNEENIKNYTDFDALQNKVMRLLQHCTSLHGYKKAMVGEISEIMRNIEKTISQQHSRPIRSACAYVEENYSKTITLEEIAGVVNLSAVYFCNLFKRETGCTFTEYVTEYRMKKARELLKNSERNISEIAYCVGFSDARYFSRIFKKLVGIKPTDYRKIHG